MMMKMLEINFLVSSEYTLKVLCAILNWSYTLNSISAFYVGSSSDFNMKLLQETASKQFASNSSAIVSEDTVQKLGEMGSVEAFTLSQFHFDSTVKDWNKKVAAESKSTQ